MYLYTQFAMKFGPVYKHLIQENAHENVVCLPNIGHFGHTSIKVEYVTFLRYW